MLDVAIIGGGPAGTAAALTTRRHGLRVAIWDRDRFPRHKVCGEFISPEALPWVQRKVPEILTRGAAIRRAEFIAQSGLRRGLKLPHPACGFSRYALDAGLWKAAAEAGIEMHQGEGIRSVWKLRGRGEEDAWEFESSGGLIAQARTLIIACGRWWRLDGFPSPSRQATAAGEWVGAKAHFAGLEPRGSVEMYIFRGGYCGLAPIEEGKYNSCCLVHRNCLRDADLSGVEDFSAWLGEVSRHPALEARLRGGRQVSPTVTTAPVRVARRSPVQDGALLVGDASGFIDPFTGEGISMALHSGRLAADAVAESWGKGLGGERAADVYRRKLGRAVRRSYRIAVVTRALIEAPAWLQSLSAAPLPWLGGWLLKETRWRGTSSYGSY
jgi:flavin-dependent dehydrogenase